MSMNLSARKMSHTEKGFDAGTNENSELLTNQMMAEGANLLQLIEENTLSVKPNHTLRLLKEAIEHVSEGKPLDDNIDSKAKGSIKLVEKILIPQKEFPFINFKGHLLGAGGKILRKIQDETESKIMILGAGSMKDNAIEEELKRSGNSMYKHLEEPLHICVVSEGPPMIAFTKMGLSLKEITKLLIRVGIGSTMNAA
ncbi:KH domain-containing, RNA-binding, signal transduction-associated protein 3-like [Gordionus sp. m RMFG-2023]|uniref:KH domain-containing, RNA-binding, signal transduction-associated protein 3-like n=1 Tax=Gordionus sp. m RMFG-2023 TaxID=3053472 RepID=UPI0031FDB9CA